MKRLLLMSSSQSSSNDIDDRPQAVLKRHCGLLPVAATVENNNNNNRDEPAENFLLLFFRALTPYEKLRILYIGRGVVQLSHPCYHNIVYKVVTLLARLSLYQEGFQRRYRRKDSPRLYDEVVQRYLTQCMQQVVQQAVALQQPPLAVPRHRIVVLCASKDKDTLVLYDGNGFVELLSQDVIDVTRNNDIVLPPLIHYECMDAKQHELVRAHLGWSRRRLKRAYVALGIVRPRQARIAANLINLILQLCSDIVAVFS